MARVKTKSYSLMISSFNLPHKVLQACAVACGVVLANYYPTEMMPLAIKDNDTIFGRSWSVTHRVHDWRALSDKSDNAPAKENSELTNSGLSSKI